MQDKNYINTQFMQLNKKYQKVVNKNKINRNFDKI